jgi:hypothetical protein
MEISLTDFVDFTLATGSTRITKVKELKRRGAYDPAADFWKRFRGGVVELHRTGKMSAKALDDIVAAQTTATKFKNYATAAAGYKRLLAWKPGPDFPAPLRHWIEGDLDVRVNPELGLELDGRRTITKLYFKSESRTRSRVQAALALMEIALPSGASSSPAFAVLDVTTGKLMRPDGRWNNSDMATLLHAEAGAFVDIWEHV